jgi:hypothetical protein
MRAAVKTTGTKGSDVFTSTGDPRLDLSVRLVRGADPTVIRDDLQAVLDLAKTDTSGTALADAFVLAFHTRAVRGGKGERALFYTMLESLNAEHPTITRAVVDLIPEFGSWRDVFVLAKDFKGTQLCGALIKLAADQLRADAAAAEGESISLCAKWAPREGKHGDEMARKLALLLHQLGGGAADAKPAVRMANYRRLVAGLNRRLNTVETLMSSGHWANIKPAAVPGRAGKLYSRAFLNLVNTTEKGQAVAIGDINKLRHPDDAGRMACREAFLTHYARARAGVAGAKVHGADTLYPHEVLKAARLVAGDDEGHAGERDHLAAVWRSMVDKARGSVGMRDCIFMSDFSGSMQSAGTAGDTPYWVSAALGMLGAVASSGAFARRLMTFDSTPKWHTFSADTDDLFACLATINESFGQGLSTDFQKAMELVLETLREARVRPGEEPKNLVVLTDMNWDQACAEGTVSRYTGSNYGAHLKARAWETHVEMIRASFKRIGEELWGSGGGWQMPRIVIWNLAASAKPLGTSHPSGKLNLSSSVTDFHATADTPGVIHLSGWSPTLFRILQEEGPRAMTPYEGFRQEIDDPRYDVVRERVREATGALMRSAATSEISDSK